MCEAAKENISFVEKELERIFSSLGFGMYVVDEEGRVTLWNRAAESILGWSSDEILRKKCSDFIAHQNDEGEQLCDRVCPLKTSINEARATFTGSVWAHRKDGSLAPVNVSCVPLFDDAGKPRGAVEIFLDVTREIELDRMKDDITSAVTFLLKSPLTAIKGSLDLLIGGEAGGINKDQQVFLEMIKDNTNKLLELANDYLDLDRLKSNRSVLHWEKVDLSRLVEESASLSASAAEEKGLELITEVDESLSTLGDPELLETMISHLIKNAVQYTIKGKINVSLRADGKHVSLIVADTGVGIPEDEQARLGERFFRASTASISGTGGSGLGITIIKEIITRHRGAFNLESSPGEGTRITVTFEASPQGEPPGMTTIP